MKTPLLKKSYSLALEIINITDFMKEDQKEYILSKQLLRSGTSIGANIREASKAQSRRDFIAKLYIALKEASETEYWIDLLCESKKLPTKKLLLARDLLNQTTALTIKSITTAKRSS